MHRRSHHHRAAVLAAAVLGLACLGSAAPALATAPGLVDTTLPTPAANPLSSPTAIVPIGQTGRALVLEKDGAVRVLRADGTMLAADALTLGVCTGSEQGLLGAAVDPGFAANGFVYLYYSRDAGDCASSTGRFNRVSRFTMTGDTINAASEVVLLDDMNIPAGNHNGGDLDIGHDGDLYVTVGDGGVNPRGGGPSAAQDLSLLNGKVLRITTTGGVPAGNPFAGAPGAASCRTAGLSASLSTKCTEIYGYGLRNPFRFAFDPNTAATRFFINDVGQSTWEEVDQGGSGRNYGWSAREGFCDTGSSTSCPPTPAGLADPLTVYNHDTGCTYITAAAFIPNGIWPAAYDGGYLFADGGCGKVFLRTGAGTVAYDSPFAQTDGVIADMAFLTQGGRTALYYVTNSSGELHKVTLPGPGVKPPPVKPPVRCTTTAVRGLLASTARAEILAHHCTVRRIVVAMRRGRPVVRGGRLVHAASSRRPKRSAGRGRTWTLRVEQTSPAPGGSYPAGARQTIRAGWEATPRAIAAKRYGHYL